MQDNTSNQKILISACLLGNKVRYDGRDNLLDHPVLQRWQQEQRIVTVCPEVSGGLPTPRPPAEIQNKFPLHIVTNDGEDVTPEFLAGAEHALSLAKEHNCCCALLKARSPSCGNLEIYDGEFNGTLVPGSGATADELMRHGVPVFNENQLDQLIDFMENMDKAETLSA